MTQYSPRHVINVQPANLSDAIGPHLCSVLQVLWVLHAGPRHFQTAPPARTGIKCAACMSDICHVLHFSCNALCVLHALEIMTSTTLSCESHSVVFSLQRSAHTLLVEHKIGPPHDIPFSKKYHSSAVVKASPAHHRHELQKPARMRTF